MGIRFYLAANILGIFSFIFSCRIDSPLFSSLGRCHANCGISPPLTAQTEIRFENRVSLTSCSVIFHLISPSFPYQSPSLVFTFSAGEALIMPSPGSGVGIGCVQLGLKPESKPGVCCSLWGALVHRPLKFERRGGEKVEMTLPMAVRCRAR